MCVATAQCLVALAVLTGMVRFTLAQAGGGGGASPAPSATASPEDPSGPAGLKRYSFTQEGGFPTPGAANFEADLLFSHRLRDDHGYGLTEGVAQYAVGITDRFQFTALLADVTDEQRDGQHYTTYDGSGIQAFLGLFDSTKEPLGLAVFQSALFGPSATRTDSRVILSLDRGAWNLTYNGGLVTTIDGYDTGSTSTTAGIQQTLGLSRTYTFTGGPVRKMSLALEGTVNSSFNEFRCYDETVAYVGPSLAITFAERWSLTLTALRQATDTRDNTDWTFAAALIYAF